MGLPPGNLFLLAAAGGVAVSRITAADRRPGRPAPGTLRRVPARVGRGPPPGAGGRAEPAAAGDDRRRPRSLQRQSGNRELSGAARSAGAVSAGRANTGNAPLPAPVKTENL